MRRTGWQTERVMIDLNVVFLAIIANSTTSRAYDEFRQQECGGSKPSYGEALSLSPPLACSKFEI